MSDVARGGDSPTHSGRVRRPCLKKLAIKGMTFAVIQGHRNCCCLIRRILAYHFVIVACSNNISILDRFRDIITSVTARDLEKSFIFNIKSTLQASFSTVLQFTTAES